MKTPIGEIIAAKGERRGENARPKGEIAYLNLAMGFGFIRRPGDTNIHFRITDIMDKAPPDLRDEVEYTVGRSDKGPTALCITFVGKPQLSTRPASNPNGQPTKRPANTTPLTGPHDGHVMWYSGRRGMLGIDDIETQHTVVVSAEHIGALTLTPRQLVSFNVVRNHYGYEAREVRPR